MSVPVARQSKQATVFPPGEGVRHAGGVSWAPTAATNPRGAARSAARSSRPAAVWALMALLLLQGISGIAGGVALVAAPDGRIMQMPVSYLDGSPFSDYLIPGLILSLIHI